MKIKKGLNLIILTVCCLVLTACFLTDSTSSNHLSASENYFLQNVALQLPNNNIYNNFSTTDGETFTYTDSNINFYTSTNESTSSVVFKNLDNTDAQSKNLGMKLRSGISLVYSITEIKGQKSYGLFKILENGIVATEEPYQKVYENANAENYYYNLGNVSDICSDYYNNFYMLDTLNNAILTFNYKDKANHDDNRIEIFLDLTDFSTQFEGSKLPENSKLALTINGKTLFILANSKVFKISVSDKKIEEINIPSTLDISNTTDFDCDCSGSLYFLKNTSSKSEVIKIDKFYNQEVLNFDKVLEEMFVEQHKGAMYYKAQNEIFVLCYDNFIASTTSYKAPVNFYKAENITTTTSLALTKNDCKFLPSPYALETDVVLIEDSLIIVLEKQLETEQEFAYCLFETENEQKFGYIKTSDIKEYATFIQFDSTNKKTFVITNVYKYPTKTSPKIHKINENTITKILGEYTFSNSDIFINYYCVEYSENQTQKIGYVCKDLVYSLSSEEIEYTGGENTPNKYSKFIEYILIIVALTTIEVVIVSFIIKKVGKKKKSDV